MKLTGAEIVVNCLKEQGVDTVFGYPGGAVLDMYDALYRDGSVRHIITAHEQGAAHAADGYARSTGKTGVVIATSGPGATNLVTGLATAFMDSIPVVAITGNVGINLLGRDSFQEIDILSITMPITKHNYIVKDVRELADTLREAFLIANTGRKGPVLVDILKNVQSSPCEYVRKNPVPVTHKPVPDGEVTDAAKALDNAKRPVMMVGGGAIASEAESEILALAEKLQTPVVSTLMGLGAFPSSHPLFLGMTGMHGTYAAAQALLNADCVLALGTRFSDRVALNRDKFAEDKTVIQIDIDAAEIDKNITTTYSILGDLKEALKTLLPHVKAVKEREFTAICEKNKQPAKALGLGEQIIARAAEIKPDVIVATDVGQHQMWTAQQFPVEKPRTLLTSGGLGTMGYGFGAAIGAAVATGKHVLFITGDGSFNMNLNEFSTAVTENLPVTILLMNNRALGMVRQWQKLFYGNRFSQTTVRKKTNYPQLAESFGAKGFVIENEKEIDKVLKEALSLDSPALVDCRISEDENVLPMIKPGQTYDKMITNWEERE